jgi:hypothetical protein
MKKLIKRLREILQKNKEDLQYLLYVGVPTGIIWMILSRFISFGEMY